MQPRMELCPQPGLDGPYGSGRLEKCCISNMCVYVRVDFSDRTDLNVQHSHQIWVFPEGNFKEFEP